MCKYIVLLLGYMNMNNIQLLEWYKTTLIIKVFQPASWNCQVENSSELLLH